MTNALIRGTVLGLLAGGLTACAATPGYPITAAPSPAAPAGQPAQPASPLSPPALTVTQPPETLAQAAPVPGPVSAQQLAPIAPISEPPPTASPVEAPRPTNGQPVGPSTESPRPKPEPVHYVATGKVVEAKGMFRDYKVIKGDHLDLIARDLRTTRASLIAANHLKNPDALKPGQHLKAPIEKVYVVQAGDTVDAVAQRFGLDPAELADLNVLPETHRLRPGEQLALPDVFHDRGPVPASAARTVISGHLWPPKGYTPPPWARGPVVGEVDGHPSQAYPSIAGPGAPSLSDSEIMAAGRGRFVWPVRGEILESFGVKDVGRRNDGVDVKAPEGTIVHAAADGDVVYAGDQVPGFGNLVLVKHADGWVTAYAHLGKVSVKMRDTVTRDQEIGQVGQTGGVSEPQLHFEVRYAPNPMDKAKPIDPLLVLPR